MKETGGHRLGIRRRLRDNLLLVFFMSYKLTLMVIRELLLYIDYILASRGKI